MHGGTVKASSAGAGQGTTITVRLPLVAAPKTQTKKPVSAKEPHGKLSRRNVLIVDDNKPSAKTLGWMLEALGQDVQLAYNGPDAIVKARNIVPDLILLDIGLPGMNGYDVCRAMRQDPALKNTVIVAQTGWGQSEHRKRSDAAGFDHHLVKPIEQEAVVEMLETLDVKAGKNG
jgi:CheY-like chemotaxis protein